MKMFTPSAYAYTCNYTYLGGRQIIFFFWPPVNYLAVTIIYRYAWWPLKIFNECHMRRPAARYMEFVGTI